MRITFNRTRLELKRQIHDEAESFRQVLSIAPDWNWNARYAKLQCKCSTFQSHQIGIETPSLGCAYSSHTATFNRTRLELKLLFDTKRPTTAVSFQSHQIGIETQHNYCSWSICIRTAFNRTRLELKHFALADTFTVTVAFNRTRLELKREFNRAALTGIDLSIAPDWNWNGKAAATLSAKSAAFNRTRLELKPSMHARPCAPP